MVGRVFTSWKEISETHSHCRKLLASVAVASHLRFRFMLWQMFTSHRKLLLSLLLVVATPRQLKLIPIVIKTKTSKETRIRRSERTGTWHDV
jgi:hypothetical protein